ncbi:MAG: glycoside hydrolase family 2 TIM barrel-domain containing protein [Isosphaeraceae bacterium]|nr:glycoside hydrolase family 2 TIM barrel-domain containing protein [Isosphaeraceae bacterium]
MARLARLWLAFCALSAASDVRAQDYIWIEGEAPAKATGELQTGGWGHPEYLSAEKWLHGSIDANQLEAKTPPEGISLTYEFKTKEAGDFEVWARLGFEFVRSPLRWRIDHGPWAEYSSADLTTDLMGLADWTEVAWARLGKARLGTGKHALEVNFARQYEEKGGKKEPKRILFGLDCFALTRGPFRPNGPYKPDENWLKPIDQDAARQVFEVKPGAAPRTETPLSGLWQVARDDEQEIQDRTGPVTKLPDQHDLLSWKGIKVPGNRDVERPDLQYCHRFLYRTKIKIPAGDSFILRFPSTALIASILVNGRYCGYSKAPYTRFDCDITRAVKPGAVNEICVSIKDYYYAIAQNGEGKSVRLMFNVPTEWMYGSSGLSSARFADMPVVLQGRAQGILEPPTLITAGPAYVEDVFAKPSVQKKEFGLEVSVRNPTDRELSVRVSNQVVPLGGEKAEKTFQADTISVPARAGTTIRLNERWADPKLWWPDDPQQYEVVTELSIDGRVVDATRTKFGFREWEWTGNAFKLNGIPWNLHADTSHNETKDPEQAVKDWRTWGVNMFRFWGTRPWTGKSQAETLDFFDAHGVVVRRSGIFDGEGASYLLVEDKDGKPVARQALFDNWRDQLRAWVKAERNHPSVFVWSIENEITYINARNLGWLPQVEPEIKKGVDMVMALDPTRPAMIDGGDALRDRSLPIYGNHYNEYPMREYPDEAYTMAKAYRRHTDEPNASPWPIGDDRPLFLGESFFVRGRQPSAYSEVGGESAFLGWPEARKGVGLITRMLAEGYRWHGVAAVHFWMDGADAGRAHTKAWQPVAALCREWNWTFGAGDLVERTFKVFNDTRSDEPIEVVWRVRVGRQQAAIEGNSIMRLKPGSAAELPIRFRVPVVNERTPGEFEITCRRASASVSDRRRNAGKEVVFHDVKSLWVIPRDAARERSLAKADLVVLDPKGAVRDHLAKYEVAFTPIESPDAIPTGAKVIVVGPDALTARQSTDPSWRAMAERGARILVLDQRHPLQYQAVPADLEATEHAGRIAFVEDLDHPAFKGLGQDDFFTWSGDHVVYRNAYKKASRGAKSLVQCDEMLSCSALAECNVRDGLLLLSQLDIGAKLRSDPVAQHLFDNMLNYCARYRPVAKTTAVVLSRGDRRAKLLENAGLKSRAASDVLGALTNDHNEIVVADASPANLKVLATHRDSLRAFHDRGGWLMLWGLTPEGLADYNAVVGQDHVIRPFRMERVSLPPVRDPILSGLTMRDVVLESTRQIFPWSGDKFPADDAFTHVVDLDDVAPFASCPKESYGWSQMTNGLVSADAWVFIFSHDLKKSDPHPRWTATLPKEEELVEFSIVPNLFYHVMTKFRLYFNGDEQTAVDLDLKPAMEKQTFPLPSVRAKTITLQPIAWKEVGTQPVVSVENIWIKAKRSERYQQEVVPLLNVGALVKYRKGRGGILLNQLKVQESEANPVNTEKKQTIVATLLRNLGAAFAGERSMVAGANLKYRPVPLDEKCNQYLTARQGWYSGSGDLGHFPVGEQKFAGVSYLVRDFRTSPLPSCIMLAGPEAKGSLPSAVTGIPVGHKADVLFFLHTLNQVRAWKAPQDPKADATAPAVFRYVIRYADGSQADVPVRYGRGVGHWVSSDPKGLPEAAVAWAAPFPGDERSGKQAVVYQMAWTNPKPGVPIASIDMTYDPKVGSVYGAPAILAITSATSVE